MSTILFSILVILFGIDIISKVRSKDKSLIWQPTTFLIIYLSYYVLLPFFKGGQNVISGGGSDASDYSQMLLLLGTLLFYLVFRLVYDKSRPKIEFRRLNSLLTENNVIRCSVVLFALAFVGYGIFNGFSLSIFSADSKTDMVFNEEGSYGHTEMYITYLISLFTFCCAVVYAIKQKISALFVIMIVLSLIIYIIGGFRYRILMLFVTVFTVMHLFSKPKNIKYQIVVPLFLVMYAFMGIMEAARMYGKGLDISAVTEIQKTGEIKEVSENMMVYDISAKCMEEYDFEDYIYFEPIVTAALMPVPRALFPWKPKGTYIRDANLKLYGTISHGNAFLNITEAYISFGWFGIIIYAWFLGWLSKLFWYNYKKNLNSIGAVALLALYNAALYQIIARGYMAQALTTFIYYVFMPFWIIMLLRKINIIKK